MDLRRLKSKWGEFTYNYQWHDYVVYLDGWVVRFAATIPILGYLILFNDDIASYLRFDELTSSKDTEFWLTGSQRLRFLYFGMLFLAAANLLYRIRRPYAVKKAQSMEAYLEWADQVLTFSDYLDMHDQIRNNDHISQDGKYWDADWDAFRADARGDEGDEGQRGGDWGAAKLRHGDLIRSVLRETYYRSSRSRRKSLTLCLCVAAIGYILLGIPSVDLFWRVLMVTFGM